MTEIIRKISLTNNSVIQDEESTLSKKQREVSLEDLQKMIRDICKDSLLIHTGIEDGFEIIFPLPDNRKQKVFVTMGRRDSDGEEIYQIFTICVKADPSLYEFALKMNMEIDYGALAIKELYGEDYLVMVDTQLVRSAQPVEIEKSIITLAEIGDDIERILTGEDIR